MEQCKFSDEREYRTMTPVYPKVLTSIGAPSSARGDRWVPYAHDADACVTDAATIKIRAMSVDIARPAYFDNYRRYVKNGSICQKK